MTDFPIWFEQNIGPYFKDVSTYFLLPMFLAYGSYTDIQKHKLFRNVSYVFIGLRLLLAILPGLCITWHSGLAFKIYRTNTAHLSAGNLIGSIIGFMIIFIVGLIFNMPVGGDVFFAAAIGFWVGPLGIVFTIGIACILFIIFAIITFIHRRAYSKDALRYRIPFGPFLSIGCILTLIMHMITEASL